MCLNWGPTGTCGVAGAFDNFLKMGNVFNKSIHARWLAAGDELSDVELDDLNTILNDLLRPADAWSSWAPSCFRADGSLTDLVQPVFDVRASPDARAAMLLAIGWERGECPSAPRLVSHVLDRLEYVCAWDLVEEAGEAGQWLSGRVEACDWLPHMRVLTRGGGADVGRGGGDVAIDGDTCDDAALLVSALDVLDLEGEYASALAAFFSRQPRTSVMSLDR